MLPHEERVGGQSPPLLVNHVENRRPYETEYADIESEGSHGVELVLRHRHMKMLVDRVLDRLQVFAQERVDLPRGDLHPRVNGGRAHPPRMPHPDRPDADTVPVRGKLEAFALDDFGPAARRNLHHQNCW